MLPAYMNELWQAYWQMSQEDRRAIDPALVSVDPLTCSEKVLPYLAWECGVDISALDTNTARKLIDGAINSHRMAGTIGALDISLKAFGNIEVKEWFETGKAPYTFDLDLSLVDTQITASLRAKLETIAKQKKNARSKLDELILSYRTSKEAYAYVGGLGESGSYAQMIDGYTNSSLGTVYSAVGSMGEVSAIATMEETIWQ